MFIAGDAPSSTKLRRSGIPCPIGARSYVHAAPTELGARLGRGSINMALLLELERKAARRTFLFAPH